MSKKLNKFVHLLTSYLQFRSEKVKKLFYTRLCIYTVATPQDIYLLNPSWTCHKGDFEEPGSFFVNVITNVPLRSSSAFILIFSIKSLEKHVEFANTTLASVHSYNRKSPFTFSIIGSLWL